PKRRKPQARGRRRGAAKEAIVLIPLTYNDGTSVARDILLSIFGEVYTVFQGWTAEGIVKGAYRMRSGQKRVEDLLKLSVVLDESRVRELEAMVAKWCARLGQETMLLKIADYVIKFVRPQTGTEEP